MKKFIVILSLIMIGCSSPKSPKPFKAGAEVTAPTGCKDGKERGVEC